MSKGLTPGAVLPDFTLPDENGTMHRLSELQGNDAMILMLGRGEHWMAANAAQLTPG
jgi:peroxiredoxin